MKRLLLVILVVIAVGCATNTPVTTPPGCENSVIYANKAQIDTVAVVMVAGARIFSINKPAEYAKIHDACTAAAQLLRSQPISLGNLTSDPYLEVMAPLLGLIPMDKVLSACDRNYLAAYLSMI